MEKQRLPFIRWKNKVFIVGLTGGLASGKSTAAEIFQKAGIRVVNADMIAKDIFERKEIQMRLVKYFGENILENGTVSRNRVASIVFKNSESINFLNSLIHPEVKKKFKEIKKEMKDDEILVYDVPLLFEENLESEFDITLTVSASREIRIQRALKRNGWTREEFLARENNQMPLEEKEKRSDAVINNDGTPSELEMKVKEFIEHIRKSCESN